MAGKFCNDQRSCEQCGEDCVADDGHKSTARYTVKRNLCSDCAGGKCASAILDASSAANAAMWRCREHRHRDVILHCVKCRRPVCEICVHLTHSGHEYEDIYKAIEERRNEVGIQHDMITKKARDLSRDRSRIEECADAVNQRFDRLRYSVLVRVEEYSKTFEEDQCISARKIEQRAKEEKLRIDRWKDSRMREIREERDKKCLEIKQRQYALLRVLDEIKQKLLDQLEEIREGVDAADEMVAEARKAAEDTLTLGAVDILEGSVCLASNSRLEECLSSELVEDTITTVTDIAGSVKFVQETSYPEEVCQLGRVVTTAPAWYKRHTIQVGLPRFRLLNCTKEANHVTFTGENGDESYGLYTMDVENGKTNLVTSDAMCVTDASPIDGDTMAVSRNDRAAIDIWNTKTGKMKRRVKVPRAWSHTYLTVNSDGMVIARDHANSHGKIHVYRPTSGEKVRSVPYRGTIFSMHSVSARNIIIQSTATEIVIIDQHGAITTSISDQTWLWSRCAVTNDDTIIVAYGKRDDPSSIFVDSYSTAGELIEHVLKHRCSPCLEHVAVAVTNSGRIVLQNGGDLIIYERLIPSVPVVVPDKSPRVLSRSSMSSPSAPSRPSVFMRIPT